MSMSLASIFVASFLLSGAGGLGWMPKNRNVASTLTACLNSGLLGLAIALLGSGRLVNHPNFLIGVSVVPGLLLPVALDLILNRRPSKRSGIEEPTQALAQSVQRLNDSTLEATRGMELVAQNLRFYVPYPANPNCVILAEPKGRGVTEMRIQEGDFVVITKEISDSKWVPSWWGYMRSTYLGQGDVVRVHFTDDKSIYYINGGGFTQRLPRDAVAYTDPPSSYYKPPVWPTLAVLMVGIAPFLNIPWSKLNMQVPEIFSSPQVQDALAKLMAGSSYVALAGLGLILLRSVGRAYAAAGNYRRRVKREEAQEVAARADREYKLRKEMGEEDDKRRLARRKEETELTDKAEKNRLSEINAIVSPIVEMLRAREATAVAIEPARIMHESSMLVSAKPQHAKVIKNSSNSLRPAGPGKTGPMMLQPGDIFTIAGEEGDFFFYKVNSVLLNKIKKSDVMLI